MLQKESNVRFVALVMTILAFVVGGFLAWATPSRAEDVNRIDKANPLVQVAKDTREQENLLANELRAKADLRTAEKTGIAMSLVGYEFEYLEVCHSGTSAAYYGYVDSEGWSQYNSLRAYASRCCVSTEDADGKSVECSSVLTEDYYESGTGKGWHKSTDLTGKMTVSKTLITISPIGEPVASWAYTENELNTHYNERKGQVTEGGLYEFYTYRSQTDFANSTFELKLPRANEEYSLISYRKTKYSTNLPPVQY